MSSSQISLHLSANCSFRDRPESIRIGVQIVEPVRIVLRLVRLAALAQTDKEKQQRTR